MNGNLNKLSRRYQAALRKHLKQGPRASLQPAQRLGRLAMTSRLETLDLARIHEQALITLVLPSHSPSIRDGMIRRAGIFFAEAITPMEETHRAALEANVELNHLIKTLRQSTTELASSNSGLKHEIVHRKVVEKSLKNSERHYSELLEQSRAMQKQLRHLSHQLLSAQEEERKKISRELHDQIAQTLTAINVELSNLKHEATRDTKNLKKKIANTQRLVEKSVDIVHRFALELRPAVLDDLGLIPALHMFMKAFTKRTGIRIQFTTFTTTKIKQLNTAKKTVFYRVAQEALTNVARHAQADLVKVKIEKLPDTICLKIKDNGKSFQAQRVMRSKRNTRLGLIGMRERLEMVGGSFAVESAPGKGTTIRAQIPFMNGNPV